MQSTLFRNAAPGDLTTDHLDLYQQLGALPGAELVWLMMTPSTLPTDFAGVLHLQATLDEVRLVPVAATDLGAHFDADAVTTLTPILDLVASDPGGTGFTVVYGFFEVLPGDENAIVMRPQPDGTTLLVPTPITALADTDELFAAAAACPLDVEAASFLDARRKCACWHTRDDMGPTGLMPCHGYS